MHNEENLETKSEKNKTKKLEISVQAGEIAGYVGVAMCWIITLACYIFARISLFSPWVIYFSSFGTYYLVKYIREKRKINLVFTVLYYVMCLLAIVFFILQLVEMRG